MFASTHRPCSTGMQGEVRDMREGGRRKEGGEEGRREGDKGNYGDIEINISRLNM